MGKEQLHRQCRHFMDLLGIWREDLIHCSYGDKLLELHEPNARIDTGG